jgi:hypothetical protein
MSNKKKRLVIYDLEVLPNFFCGVFEAIDSDKCVVYEISNEKNDSHLIKVMAMNFTLVGYNNHHYDDLFINMLLKEKDITNEKLYYLSSLCVKRKECLTDNEKRHLNKYKYNKSFDSIDVLTMLASSKLRVSLKHLQVKIKWHRVQDFEVDWTQPLPEIDWETLIDYCINDVKSLKAVVRTKEKDFILRDQIQEKYGLDFRSMDGVKIAETLLCTHIAEQKGIDIKEFISFKNERVLEIPIGPLINDFISFTTPKMQKVLDYFKNKIIYYFDNEEKNKKQLDYRVIYNNVPFDLGLGGIHAWSDGQILEPTDIEYLVMPDVVGFYPNQVIKNKYCHPHDPYFIEKYTQAYKDKEDGKKEKNTTKEALGKLVGNSSFGKLLSVYSPLYAPKLGYKITVNGQLMLLMLIERLTLASFKVVGANTDAIEVFVSKSRYAEYLIICNEWEEITKMKLDHDKFTKLYRMNCNNYIALKADEQGRLLTDSEGKPKLKLKGFFDAETDLLKGYEYPVVKKALTDCFVANYNQEEIGERIKDFILASTDIYDFCMSVKMGTSSKTGEKFNAYHNNRKLQKTNRYYAASGPQSAYLYKSSNEIERLHVLKDSKVIIFNDYIEKPMNEYNINYGFYIDQAMKIKDKIMPSQLKLF